MIPEAKLNTSTWVTSHPPQSRYHARPGSLPARPLPEPTTTLPAHAAVCTVGASRLRAVLIVSRRIEQASQPRHDLRRAGPPREPLPEDPSQAIVAQRQIEHAVITAAADVRP